MLGRSDRCLLYLVLFVNLLQDKSAIVVFIDFVCVIIVLEAVRENNFTIISWNIRFETITFRISKRLFYLFECMFVIPHDQNAALP